jgi:hypothetical protein
MSPVDTKQFELERVVTLLKSFEWKLVSSDMSGNRVLGKFEKVIEGKPQELMRFELDRITNVLKSAGWSLVSSAFEATKVVGSFEKVIPAAA